VSFSWSLRVWDAGWRRASALRLWAETKRLQKRNRLDNNLGYAVAGGPLLGKRRA